MLLRQAEYFVALARQGHFARAAQECGVSQPTLSDGIRRLEEELGVPLARRRHAFAGLTPEGERLVTWAQRLLATRDALEQEAITLRGGLRGTLRIGVIPSASTTVAGVLARFHTDHPHAAVTIESKLATDEIVRRVAAFELDAGICYPFDRHGELARHDLYSETWTFLASDEILPEPPDRITWAEAARHPLAVLDPGIHGISAMSDAFAAAGVTPEIGVQTDSVASLFALVNTGHWASVIPDRWAKASGSATHLTFVELAEPHVHSRVVLTHEASTPMSPLVRALRESLTTSGD